VPTQKNLSSNILPFISYSGSARFALSLFSAEKGDFSPVYRRKIGLNLLASSKKEKPHRLVWPENEE